MLMTTNGFVSFPSSQIIYMITGYFIFTGDLNLGLVLLVGTVGNTLGNFILYEVARYKGLQYILSWKIFPAEIVMKVVKTFEKRGKYFLFVGKLLPAIKVFIPIPAGLSKMNRILFGIIILITSAIWAGIFIAIGYFFGKSSEIFGYYAPILIIVSIIVIYIFYKMMYNDEIKKN